ncbi:3158_t:CDS:2 [Scutellospora calospora]|uniref:3158_t:CDS:1 n=1 Tax=Scutellospora calospora TaxID=85575 RepID=A0ACA9L7M0_9GLOM|nr:3158_t:CDS:2 [Scutellospora calospora]
MTSEQKEKIFALSKDDKTKQSISPSSSYDAITTFSQSSVRKVLRSSLYEPLDHYIVRPLSHSDNEKFKILLLRLTVSCKWAFNWVNKPEAQELFEFLNPHLKLPDRRTLSGQILETAVSEHDVAMYEALREDLIGETLIFDGSERESYVSVMEKTNTMIEELKSMNIKVSAVVTDSAGPYAAARRRLRLIHRDIVFLPCYAHQLNLCIGEVFKESTDLKTTMDQALQILAINYQLPYAQSRRRTSENLIIHRKIFEIIDSDSFWSNLIIIAEILYPYCKILNILQCDNARLVQVIHSLAYLVQFWTWSGKEPNCILSKFNDFYIKIYPFDDNTYNQFGDIVRYWNFAGASTNELGLVACKLYGICVNAAAVKRLWSYDVNYQISINNEHNEELDEIVSEPEGSVDLSSNENDEVLDSDSLEAEFSQFLDELTNTDDEDDEVLSSVIKDIIHLSLDPKSK